MIEADEMSFVIALEQFTFGISGRSKVKTILSSFAVFIYLN
jgi:hypothetical protein